MALYHDEAGVMVDEAGANVPLAGSGVGLRYFAGLRWTAGSIGASFDTCPTLRAGFCMQPRAAIPNCMTIAIALNFLALWVMMADAAADFQLIPYSLFVSSPSCVRSARLLALAPPPGALLPFRLTMPHRLLSTLTYLNALCGVVVVVVMLRGRRPGSCRDCPHASATWRSPTRQTTSGMALRSVDESPTS